MKDEITNEIIQKMLPHLNNAQLDRLKSVLMLTFSGCEISKQSENDYNGDENHNLCDLFLASKRVEGCSEKTIRYYQATIEKTIGRIGKDIRNITTEDLRCYLTDYRENNNSSKVTVDNIRRVLSSFFSWLEDEDYIIKSPARRIHKVKTSSIIKSDKKLLRINRKLANIRHNHLHQATTAIIKRKPSFICLEDLNVKGMMSNRHLSEATQEQKFYEFRRQIEYKAKWAKIPVIIADRYFPSSKTCIRCGKVKKDLKLSDRIYKCECGNIIDRDFQAALNLKLYGEEQLKKSVC